MLCTLYSGCQLDSNQRSVLNHQLSAAELSSLSHASFSTGSVTRWDTDGLTTTIRVNLDYANLLVYGDVYTTNYIQIDDELGTSHGYFVDKVVRINKNCYEFQCTINAWDFVAGLESSSTSTVGVFRASEAQIVESNESLNGALQILPIAPISDPNNKFVSVNSTGTWALAVTCTSNHGEKRVAILRNSLTTFSQLTGEIVRDLTCGFRFSPVNGTTKFEDLSNFELDKVLLIPSGIASRLPFGNMVNALISPYKINGVQHECYYIGQSPTYVNLVNISQEFKYIPDEEYEYIFGCPQFNQKIPFYQPATGASKNSVTVTFTFTNIDIDITLYGEHGDTSIVDWFDISPNSRDTSMRDNINKLSSTVSGVSGAVTSLSSGNIAGGIIGVGSTVSSLFQPPSVISGDTPKGLAMLRHGFGVFRRKWINAPDIADYVKNYGWRIINGFAQNLILTAQIPSSAPFRYIKLSDVNIYGVNDSLATAVKIILYNGVRIYSSVAKYLQGRNTKHTEVWDVPTYTDSGIFSHLSPSTLIGHGTWIHVLHNGNEENLYKIPNDDGLRILYQKGITSAPTIEVQPATLLFQKRSGTALDGSFSQIANLHISQSSTDKPNTYGLDTIITMTAETDYYSTTGTYVYNYTSGTLPTFANYVDDIYISITDKYTESNES